MKKRKKIIFNPSNNNTYNLGGLINKAGGAGGVASLAGAGLQLIDTAKGNTSLNKSESALSGALSGASAGMTFGPFGAAIGGVLGAGAGLIGSAKALDNKIEGLNKEDINEYNRTSAGPNGMYAAMGGYLPSGGDSSDKFNSFDEGGAHEQNPLGGIPQGVGSNGKPNFVEQGETSYKFSDGTKFIFSDRIKIKK